MTPSTPGGWSVISGVALIMISAAIVGTWPLCILMLALYRRAVARGMRRTGPVLVEPPAFAPAPVAAGTRPPIQVIEAGTGPTSPLLGAIRRRGRGTRLIFGLAGLSYALGAVVVFSVIEELEWLPMRTLSLAILFGWPLVPTLLALAPPGRRMRVLVLLGAALAVVGLLLGVGLPVGQAVLLIALLVALPAIFVLATSARTLRGAAWLAAPGLALLGLVLWLISPVVTVWQWGGGFGLWSLSRVLVGVALLALLPAYGFLVAHVYSAKWASDESLWMIQWWFVATVPLALFIGVNGWRAAVVGMAPYVLFLLVLLVGAMRFRPQPVRPVRLLLLRTFGDRHRSTRLLRDVVRQWRWIGSVELITAPDVATETLEPDEFLDFLRGALARRFVTDTSQVSERLAGLDLLPDRDGRFRINELMCHDDTWRPTVHGLIGAVDVVLLDLRGFTAGNAGVVEELERLTALVPLRRVVVLIDETTDFTALQHALQHAAVMAPPWSPLVNDPFPALKAVSRPHERGGSHRLLTALVAAAQG